MRVALSRARIAPGLLAGLAACAPAQGAPGLAPAYLGAEVVPLDSDIMRIRARVSGTPDARAASAYADCVAAGVAQAGRFGFVRHLRTIIDKEGGIWRADAVYTASPVLPRGLRTIDVEVAVSDCADQGIPTV